MKISLDHKVTMIIKMRWQHYVKTFPVIHRVNAQSLDAFILLVTKYLRNSYLYSLVRRLMLVCRLPVCCQIMNREKMREKWAELKKCVSERTAEQDGRRRLSLDNSSPNDF